MVLIGELNGAGLGIPSCLRRVGVNDAFLGCFFVVGCWCFFFVLARVADRAFVVCERRLNGACVCCLVEGEGFKSCVRSLKSEHLCCCRRVLAVLSERAHVSVDCEALEILEPVLEETTKLRASHTEKPWFAVASVQKIIVLNGLVCLFDVFKEEFVLPRFECFSGIYGLVRPMHHSGSVRSKAPSPPASNPVLAV
jgi:hypothetical protein